VILLTSSLFCIDIRWNNYKKCFSYCYRFQYCRLCITYTLAGFLFDLDQSNICRDIQKIESLVTKCVPISQKMHKTTKRLSTPEEFGKYFPGFLSFLDCSKQQIPRPENKRRKKIHYSGKNKGLL
jgi:hypothetical protein